MNARKILSAAIVLALSASTALGANVPRRFPDGVSAQSLDVQRNDIAQKWSFGIDSSGPGGTNGFYLYDSTTGKYNLGVTTSGALVIKGGGATNATSTQIWRNSADTTLGYVDNSGAFRFGPSAGGVLHGWYGGIAALSVEATLSDGMSVANRFGLAVNAATGSIQGFSGGTPGQLIYVRMGGSGSATLVHNGSGTQKFLLPGGVNLSLAAYDSAILLFEGSAWVVLSHTK